MRHLGTVMTALRHAWDGDTKTSADYLELLIEKLEADGEAFQAKQVREQLAVLRGERDPIYVKSLAADS